MPTLPVDRSTVIAGLHVVDPARREIWKLPVLLLLKSPHPNVALASVALFRLETNGIVSELPPFTNAQHVGDAIESTTLTSEFVVFMFSRPEAI
jgi:hypothetical protein